VDFLGLEAFDGHFIEDLRQGFNFLVIVHVPRDYLDGLLAPDIDLVAFLVSRSNVLVLFEAGGDGEAGLLQLLEGAGNYLFDFLHLFLLCNFCRAASF